MRTFLHLMVAILLFNILQGQYDVKFQISINQERLTEDDWIQVKNSMQIEFRLPSNIEPIRLSEINNFNYTFDPYYVTTTFEFTYPVRDLLKGLYNSLIEVRLVDRSDEYTRSNRKRFNLLSEAQVSFNIKRKAFRAEIKLLNTGLRNPIIMVDNEPYHAGEDEIKGEPDSKKIRHVYVTAPGYSEWEANLFEGKLVQEKELLVLLIPKNLFAQFEKAVYLFQLGYLDDADEIFRNIRRLLPDWGYSLYYIVLITYFKNNTLSATDIVQLHQAFTYAEYEKNYLLMAEIKYLLSQYYTDTRNFSRAGQEAEEGMQFIKNEMELFQDGRHKLYFVNFDLGEELEFIKVKSEIYDFYLKPVTGNIAQIKNDLNLKLFNIYAKLKRLVATNDGLIEMYKHGEEVTKLRTLINNKN